MARPRVFVSGKLSEEARNELCQFADMSVHDEESSVPPQKLLEQSHQADAIVCVFGDIINALVMDACPRLKLVANVAVGYDNVEVGEATRRGIVVTNTPGVLDNATADLAFALMLAAARRLVEGDKFVRAGSWKGWRRDLLLGQDITGKTIGIIGMGRIGEAMARRANGFGMHIIYVRSGSHERRDHKDEKDRQMETRYGATRVAIEELLKRSDYISIHCPLGPTTYHLLGEKEFESMKSNCILVNTARGAVIDEKALVEALKNGRIAGAGLDVFESEPFVPDELTGMDNVVLAPHIGSATTATRTGMDLLAISAVKNVLSGTKPTNIVNPEVWPQFLERLQAATPG